MAQASLSDVIERIRAEGQLQRNSGTNSLKSIKDLLSNQNDIMSNGFDGLISAITSDALANKELKMENDRLNERLLQALQDLQNQGGGAGGPNDPPVPALGAAGLALAGTIGGLLGILQGQFKAIQAFSKLFTPEWVRMRFDSVKTTVGGFLDTFKNAVSERINAVKAGITNGINRFKAFFTISEDSALYKLGQGLRAKIDGLVDIFKPVKDTIVGITEGAGQRLSRIWHFISNKLVRFKELVTKISGVVGKVFAPIAVIMTAWETITGFLKGYEEDGILGGLQGAIEGFFSSLITMPLDLVTSAVGWVAGKLGWDEGAKAITDFLAEGGFTGLFGNIMDGLFGYIKSAVNFFVGLFTWDENNPVVAALKDVSTFLTDMVTTVKNFMVESFNNVVDAIQSFDLMATLGNVGNLAEEFLKNLLKAVLPAADSLVFDAPSVTILGKSFGGGQINLNPIPDSLYEWMNQPVPDVTPEPAAAGASGDELSAAEARLQETQQEVAEGAAAGAGGNAQVGVDASTNINQRSDTVYVETDLSARNGDGWSNMDQEAYLRMAASGNYGG